MADRIGPRFFAEVRAAGIGMDGWTVQSDGTFAFAADVSEETRAALAAVLAAHDPARPAPGPRVITPYEFRRRFSDAERLAIYTAEQASPALRDLLDDLRTAQAVGLDDPRTAAGLDALVAAGLIARARKAEILA